MIVYYTGTGNSRYAAEYLASATGDEMMDAVPYIQSGTAAALTSENRGFSSARPMAGAFRAFSGNL